MAKKRNNLRDLNKRNLTKTRRDIAALQRRIKLAEKNILTLTKVIWPRKR